MRRFNWDDDPDAAGPHVGDSLTETLQAGNRTLRDDLVAATAARRRILGHAGPGESQGAPAATWIGQAPLRDPRSCIEVLATALVPHADQGPSWLPDAACPASCRCADCKPGHRGRMVRIGNHLHLHAAGRSEERRVGKECRSRWSPYH